jgi:hypothetical protein
MTTTPVQNIEPGKRVLRTLLVLILAIILAAGVLVPVLLPLLHVAIPSNYYPKVAVGGGVLVAFSAGLNALLNLPEVTKILPSWLKPSAVEQAATDIESAATGGVTSVKAALPAVEQVAKDVTSDAAASTTLQDATKDAPEVIASARQIVADVETVAKDVQPMAGS